MLQVDTNVYDFQMCSSNILNQIYSEKSDWVKNSGIEYTRVDHAEYTKPLFPGAFSSGNIRSFGARNRKCIGILFVVFN